MSQAAERLVELEEIQVLVSTLWKVPSPLDYTPAYQDFCRNTAFPLITDFLRQKMKRPDNFSTKEGVFDAGIIAKGKVRGILFYQFKPDLSQSGLGEAWVSYSSLDLSWPSEREGLWSMSARIEQYPGICRLIDLEIRLGDEIKYPLSLVKRRELEAGDQRARYF